MGYRPPRIGRMRKAILGYAVFNGDGSLKWIYRLESKARRLNPFTKYIFECGYNFLEERFYVIIPKHYRDYIQIDQFFTNAHSWLEETLRDYVVKELPDHLAILNRKEGTY